jgi:hypothetical protein
MTTGNVKIKLFFLFIHLMTSAGVVEPVMHVSVPPQYLGRNIYQNYCEMLAAYLSAEGVTELGGALQF